MTKPSEQATDRDRAANRGFIDPARLHEVLDGHDNVLVFCHMNPDPDSLASGLAMKHLLERRFGKTVFLTYRGIIGRAQNREMVRILLPELKRFSQVEELDFSAAVLVDAQPQFGFNPEDLAEQDVPVVACVDHHPFVDSTRDLPYFDVRPDLGATSTIMTEYLRLFSVVPSSSVATALYYGIKTDTLGLTRRTSDHDRAAYEYLLPFVDHEKLMAIESPPLTRSYFRDLRDALQTARVFGKLVVTHIGRLPYPDMVAEIADLLLKVEGVSWSVCMGLFEGLLYVSVRTEDPEGDAGVFIRQVVGDLGQAGGHNTMAAARLPISAQDAAEYGAKRNTLMARMLDRLDLTEVEGVDLVS
ncbi:MAG: DHH family phosphoesterase [Planctomycetes bacterium]|nr:DHH family phosphoesterase [Planctomycetota bacterium]